MKPKDNGRTLDGREWSEYPEVRIKLAELAQKEQQSRGQQ